MIIRRLSLAALLALSPFAFAAEPEPEPKSAALMARLAAMVPASAQTCQYYVNGLTTCVINSDPDVVNIVDGTFSGTVQAATLNATSSVQVGGAQIDFNDLAGLTAITTSSTGPHVFGGAAAGFTQVGIRGSYTSDGSSTVATKLWVGEGLTGASGDTSYITKVLVDGTITTQGAAETITSVSTLRLVEPGITVGSGDTVTNAVTLHVTGAPTEGGSNNYALWIDDGVSRFDGIVTTSDRLKVIATTDQQSAVLNVRTLAAGSGNQIEFGHTNAGGYGSSIGAHNGTGMPFIAFLAEASTTSNTFRTRGFKPAIFNATSGGLLYLSTVANTNADAQALVNNFTWDLGAGDFSTVGDITVGGDLIVPATGKVLLDGSSLGHSYTTERAADIVATYAGGLLGLDVNGVSSTVDVQSGFDFTVDNGAQIFIDGGGDTYAIQGSTNRWDFYAGGSVSVQMAATWAAIPATNKLYLDGGSNTFAHEPSADRYEIVSGGTIRAAWVGSTVDMDGVYANTTGSAANVNVDSNGVVQRSTSSLRYKHDVADYSLSDAHTVIAGLRPITYRGKDDTDQRRWLGFIAEDIHDLYERHSMLSPDGRALPVTYADLDGDGTLEAPDYVTYDRLVIPLVAVVQGLTRRVSALERALLTANGGSQ